MKPVRFVPTALVASLMHSEAKDGVGAFIAHSGLADGRKITVCVGDSITRGQVSCNYVDMLKRELESDFCFVNAGINGELSFNVLARIENVVRCSPDYVTILIGTNDAHAMIDARSARRARRYNLLAKPPSTDSYASNLKAIVNSVGKKTEARIALLSIPPIGEERDGASVQLTREFARVAREVALETRATYLPLFEEMAAVLASAPRRTNVRAGYSDLLLLRNFIDGKLLGRNYDEIAARRQFVLHTDLLHLSCGGAAMVSRLISSFLRQ